MSEMLQAALAQITLRPHQWASGTAGWLAVGKANLDGIPHQCAVNVYVVGSKTGASTRPDGAVAAVETFVLDNTDLNARIWKTGTKGYWGQARGMCAGVKVLADVSLFQIRSK